MDKNDTFEKLFHVALDLDEAGLERGNEAIIGDLDIRLMLRENRIALRKGHSKPLQQIERLDPGLMYYDVPLVCVVHSHPECRFRWARLMIDLSPTRQARILDMSPREVRGDKPIELKTTIGAGLKFDIIAKVLSTEVKPEVTASRTVYYPEIVSAGTGFTKGYWDFLALTSDYLHANRELRVLVSAPAGKPLLGRFNLRAKIGLAGVAGLIPLLARIGEINETYRLDQQTVMLDFVSSLTAFTSQKVQQRIAFDERAGQKDPSYWSGFRSEGESPMFTGIRIHPDIETDDVEAEVQRPETLEI